MDRFRGAGRLLAIAAAVVLAGIAAAAVYVYVQGIEQRTLRGAELVDVYVANEDIPAGISGEAASDASIEQGTTIRDAVPGGAITGLDEITDLVTTSPIYAGEVITRNRFEDVAEAAPSLDIPDDMEAVSVQVGAPQGVAGFVSSGDRVSLIATLEAAAGTEDEEPAVQSAQYVLQDVLVLATGQLVGETADDVQTGGEQVLLTVALEPEDAERLVFAINQSTLYFTLLPEDAPSSPSTPGTTLEDLFP